MRVVPATRSGRPCLNGAAVGNERDVTETGPESPQPGVPSDNTTLLEVLASLEEDGYRSQLAVTADGFVQCGSCGVRIDPHLLRAMQIRRLEGASDPDDMVAIVATTCPNCAREGTIVMGYGVNATGGEPAVARALARGT
jgi:hypothetical protein